MKAWWRALDRQTRLVFGLAVGFVAFRTTVASLSGFGFHQGWNEGHYALIAEGFIHHPLVPWYGDLFVYNVPPLFPYVVSGSFLAFGESVLAARLPTILATGGLIVATYELGRTVFEDRSIAILGAIVLAVLPYIQLYGGRTQTDAMMVFFTTASVTAIVRGYRRDTGYRTWLVAGGALFAAAFATKQPALLVAGVVLFWLVGNRWFDNETVKRTLVLVAASGLFLLPVFVWLYLNYLAAPAAFVADWEHELFSRTSPFANLPLLGGIAFGLGVTPPVLAVAGVGVFADLRDAVTRYREGEQNPGPTVLTWWLVLFGLFVLARTPHGHQYYAVVLAPPIALFAALGVHRTAAVVQRLGGYRQEAVHLGLVVVVVSSGVAGTVVLFELSGEFSAANGGGTHVAGDASEFVRAEVPDDATVLVSNGYAPPVKWYVREEFPVEQVDAYRVASVDEREIERVVSESAGPVYIIAPRPFWGELPDTQMRAVYESETYEYTIMGAMGEFVQSDSKFSFYLEDRQLVVYRVAEQSNGQESVGARELPDQLLDQ